MGHYPLVTEEIASGADLIRHFARFAPVAVAFWLQMDEAEYRYLYIASQKVHPASRGLAYAQILRILEEYPSISIEPARIILISDEDPLALAALQSTKNDSANLATRLHSVPLGHQTIEEAYIYPLQMSENFSRYQGK